MTLKWSWVLPTNAALYFNVTGYTMDAWHCDTVIDRVVCVTSAQWHLDEARPLHAEILGTPHPKPRSTRS